MEIRRILMNHKARHHAQLDERVRETSRLRPSGTLYSGLSREIHVDIGTLLFPLLRQLFTDSSSVVAADLPRVQV